MLELILIVIPVLLDQVVDSRSLIIVEIASSPHYRQYESPNHPLNAHLDLANFGGDSFNCRRRK